MPSIVPLDREASDRAKQIGLRTIGPKLVDGLVEQGPGLLAGASNWTDLVVPGLVLIACLLAAIAFGATLRGRGRSRTVTPAAPPVVRTRAARVEPAPPLISLPSSRVGAPGVSDPGPRHAFRP